MRRTGTSPSARFRATTPISWLWWRSWAIKLTAATPPYVSLRSPLTWSGKSRSTTAQSTLRRNTGRGDDSARRYALQGLDPRVPRRRDAGVPGRAARLLADDPRQAPQAPLGDDDHRSP